MQLKQWQYKNMWANMLFLRVTMSCLHAKAHLAFHWCLYNKYMLFAGREVRIGKNCARGLEYGPRPQAEGRSQDRGHSFCQYGPT